jgi:hypothetical protein
MPHDNRKRRTSRRKFLTKTGLSAVGLASLPAVTAASERSEKSASEAGISTALKKLAAKGKFQQAQKLCNKHGVPNDFSKGRLPSFDTSKETDNGDVEPADAFKYSDSYLYLYSWFERTDPEGQSIYSVECYADIAENDANVLDDANPRDGIAIYWSDTYFQSVESNQSNYYEVGRNTGQQYYQDYHTYGVWAKFDDNYIQDRSAALDGNVEHFTCGFRTEIEKLQSGNKFNVDAQYLHNWNFGGIYYVSSFNLGPIGLNFGGSNVDSWRHEETIKV